MKKSILLCFISFVVLQLNAQNSSWETLFDGKTLAGWNRLVGKADYKVEKGMIMGVTVANTDQQFSRL